MMDVNAPMKDQDTLVAELERLFELDELLDLSRNLLDFDPEEIGSTAARGSFARALAGRCVERDAVEALCDAVLATKPEAGEALSELRHRGLRMDESLEPGARLSDWILADKLGEGRLGICYRARADDRDLRVKILRRESTRDQRGLYRFMTFCRLLDGIEHPALPANVQVETVDRRVCIVHALVAGQSLAERLRQSGPIHFNEARGLLRVLLEALAALHEKRLCHGDLRLENLIARADEADSLVVVDAGSDRLRARPRLDNGRIELFATIGSPTTVSPEQIRGLSADARSDVYSFGALLYQVLSAKPMFAAPTALDSAFAHLSATPPKLSEVAPHGWVPQKLDDLVAALVEKDPAARPQDAREVLDAFERLERATSIRPAAASDEGAVDACFARFAEDPKSSELALELEATTELGTLPQRIAEAFVAAAEGLLGDQPDDQEIKKSLLFRAGRLYERKSEDLPAAAAVYQKLCELDPEDAIAFSALEAVWHRQGKHEELIEMLLLRAEACEGRLEKARLFADIGRTYLESLSDAEQALVAYTQAVCEAPTRDDYAIEVERLAGTKESAWAEVLESCSETVREESLANDLRNALWLRMGHWYQERVGRFDLALPCYNAVVENEPASDAALAGMTNIYRKAQQWAELASVLAKRADSAVSPQRARDLRADAAEVLEQRLNDVSRARELYERILTEDPAHARTSEALGQIYERAGDHESHVRMLERRAAVAGGDDKVRLLLTLAEVVEHGLKNDDAAIRRYEDVLDNDPKNLDALKAIDRILSRLGRYQDLIENLEQQIAVAATPRQKISLWTRVAGIHDEEFLNHFGAASAWEEVLKIDEVNEQAFGELSRHYRALGRWDDLVAMLERQLDYTIEADQRLALSLSLGRVFAEQLASPERATRAYERALELAPAHASALEALAKLRESAGDADAALEAIDALAAKAESNEAKAEQFLRAAKLLEGRGDRDRAIQRYKQALDATPKSSAIAAALRESYIERGDVNAALELMDQELKLVDGDRAKAKIAGKIAALALSRLKDRARAEVAARRAMTLDPTNLDARKVLGDIAFDDQHFLEASTHYASLVERADTLPKEEAVALSFRQVDALNRCGSADKALDTLSRLLELFPDDREVLERAAAVVFDHGPAKRAAELYKTLVDSFGSKLGTDERARAYYRYGESLRLANDFEAAVTALEEAADLDPASALPLTALVKAHEARGEWERVIKAKTRHLDIASGDERVQLLIEAGDIASSKLDDRTLAAKNYVAALDERPDDRRLLTKLMQLYSEEKDWGKLVEVVLRLADFVEDPAQKVKYLHTAAIVTAQQVGDVDRALEYYEQVLALDPKLDRALDEVCEIEHERGRHERVEALLKRKLDVATEQSDSDAMLQAFNKLGLLYEKDLGWMEQAIDAYEAAQMLEPDNRERNEKLSALYANDPQRYLDKAIRAQEAALRESPFRQEAYKTLRRLYTETKHADASWCLCQTLVVLNLAEPDEERFFRRMRPEFAAPAQEALTDEDWLGLLMHPDADPLLTSVFALLEPAVIATRSETFEKLGYNQAYAIHLASHPAPLSQNLNYAAGVLGIQPPPCFENPNDPGGLSFLHAREPACVLGVAAMNPDIPAQAAAFLAARHLTYLRPGMYLRHLVPSITGLKSWLFSAIKLTAPQFPVAPELEGAVGEALVALRAALPSQGRDHLMRVVTTLLQSGAALDLKRWIAGVDLTADRAGFVVCHDLETAADIIRASTDESSDVPSAERFKELVLYSTSSEYLKLREKLQITVDT